MSEPALHPRAQRTRSALIAAGFELLAERPIDAIAIDEVVARAGVAKGSFFNHFTDKPGFGHAVAAEVRRALERRVDAANAGVTDPVERLVGGMRVAMEFALDQRVQAIVMMRGLDVSTAIDHELNRGIRSDVEALVAAGLARPEAVRSGVRFWLGVCQIAMLNVIERKPDRAEAAQRLREMAVLGLTGLGVDDARARAAAKMAASRMNP